jgi:tRNA dimethylallyltransferase
VLNNDRAVLYDRIDKRVDTMFDAGLVEEVTALRDKGYSRNLVSMQGIGYKEIYASLDGEYDLDRARYIIKRDTRHFAKRQITWFKREKDVTWMNYPDYNNSQAEMLDAMLKMIKERGIIKR